MPVWSGWKLALAAVGATCLCTGLAALGFQHLVNPVPTVLQPSGPYPVQRAQFAWPDAKRATNISVLLWYPALEQKLPLLLLSPAMGRTPADYSALGTELASFGYLVFGVTPTRTASIDLARRSEMQPLVESWMADLRFALDRLQAQPGWSERIDAHKIGVLGHSFGGAVAIHLLRADPRFRRAANLDGVPQGTAVTGLTRPLLIVFGAPLPPTQKRLNDAIVSEVQAICASNSAGCQWEDRPEAQHMNFSDAGLSPSPIPLLRSRQELANIDGRAFLYSTAALLRAFLDDM